MPTNKRRLLSLNTYHYRRGGSDAVFLDHDALFRELGWRTAVFTMQHPENEPSPWSRYFADELEFGNAYSLSQKLLMASKVIYSWEARSKLERLMDDFTPDIAHAHCIYHHLSPSVLSLLHQRGIPTVMTAHDLKLACPAYKMLNKNGICEKCRHGNLFHLITNRCIHDSIATSALVALESAIHKTLRLYKKNLSKVIAPSQFFRDKLLDWGWDPSQVTYIPNYIDITTYAPNYSPGDYYLYFGRLAPEKGVETLIKAAQEIGSRLLIAGTGPYEATLRALLPKKGNRIEFLGYCQGERLQRLVREAKAIVLPSEWYENAPISVLEAYASGKPVIGARIGGIPEMVDDNVTGLLFTSGDIDDLSKCLSRVQAMSSNEIMAMGRQARSYVATHFSKDLYVNRMLQLYRAISAAGSSFE